MGFRCHFHKLFEECCSIYTKPKAQIVYEPDCCGPVTCAGPSVGGGAGGLAALPHATGTMQVTLLWLHSQNRSTQMAENKRLRGPPRFSCVSSPLPSPWGSAPSPSSSPALGRALHHSQTDKRPRSKHPQCGQAERGATECHSVLSLDFVFNLLFKCQRKEVHLGANKSFRQNGCYSNCVATN